MTDDKDLTPSDIQVLSNRDALASFFAGLGYNTDARLPQTAAAMGITAESLQRQVTHIERLASQENGAEPLEVYLIELTSVTVAATQGISRALRNRAGNYLLVLTDDYEQLDFVLLERSLPAAAGSTMVTRSVTVRPRVLTVSRRTIAQSSVALRVLRRFTCTEADSDAQFDKLLSAYTVAEWSEPLFNNRALFSDYYLNERLPDRPEWLERPENTYHRLRDLMAGARRRLSGQLADHTHSELLQPTFEALGFTLSGPQSGADSTRPYYRLTGTHSGDAPIALCLTYGWNRNLDGRDETRDEQTAAENPTARVVTLLESGDAPWAIVTNGKLWRLYSAKAHSRATNYYEIDLEETLAMEDPNVAFRYFWLFFRAAAFTPRDVVREGIQRTLSFTDELVEDSEDYAKNLGERLKGRVFEDVFPHFAEGFIDHLRSQPPIIGAQQGALLPAAQQLALKREPDEEFRRQVFHGTLTFLYRLLFLLYAESRDLLPVKEVRGYWERSLTRLREEVANKAGDILDEAPARLRKTYSADSTSLYDRLLGLFAVIDQGERDLNVPLYNGGLFLSHSDAGDDSPEAENARFLLIHRIPDRYLALGLDRLTRDIDDRRQSLVFIDYKSMGVRQLGSIYEGLLEFRVRVAPEQMAVVQGKKTEEVVPYTEAIAEKRKILTRGRGLTAQQRVYETGDVYLENDRRERKATGSYYTPDHIVKYIVEHAIGPVLEERLEKLRPKFREAQQSYHKKLANAAAFRRHGIEPDDPAKVAISYEPLVDELFDLRVLDPAMGSGHFLVEAVDFICDHIIGQKDGFLQAFPWNPVTVFLANTRAAIQAEMERQGISIDASRLTDINLLKRHVLKRCIYGVDLNPMAVELAKVSLWLDCFTLGAPLSFLDHHLKCGNSLIGTTVQEVEAELVRLKKGHVGDLFGGPFQGLLSATAMIEELRRIPDATAEQAARSRSLYAGFEESQSPYKTALDIWVSYCFGNSTAREYLLLVMQDFRQELRTGGEDLPKAYQEAIRRARVVSVEKRFFHWDLEFPEAFVDLETKTWKPRAAQGFDSVVGNPPYGVALNSEEKSYWRDRFNVSPQPMNLAGLFYIHALNRLAINKAVGMIVPKSITYSRGWQPVAAALIPYLQRLIDASQAFEDVLLEQVVAICTDTGDCEYVAGVFAGGEVAAGCRQSKDMTAKTKVLVTGLDPRDAALGKRLLRSVSLFGDVTETFRGLPWQRHLAATGLEPLLAGKDLGRYAVREDIGKLIAMPKDSQAKVQLLRQPKIVSQNIVAHIENPSPHIRVVAALDIEGRLDLDTVNNTISRSEQWPLEVLLALMNSKLYSWYMYRFIYNQAIRTMHFDSEYVGQLPLPELPGTAERDHVVRLVRAACSCRARGLGDDFKSIDQEIDSWVYAAFRLAEQEIADIEAAAFHGDS